MLWHVKRLIRKREALYRKAQGRRETLKRKEIKAAK